MNTYLQNTLLMLNIQQNKTNTTFFSTENINLIQKQLIQNTQKYTGYTISKQNCTDLVTVMQYFYVNYTQYTINDDEYKSNVINLNNLVRDNPRLVLERCNPTTTRMNLTDHSHLYSQL